MSIFFEEYPSLGTPYKLSTLGGIYLFIFLLALALDAKLSGDEQALELRDGYYKIVFTKKGERPSYRPTKSMPKDWVPLSKISPSVIHSVVVSEDNRFFQHHGIDLWEMKAAVEDKLLKGKRMRGASTISQQTVKNLYLTHDRNILRKFKEIVMVTKIEEVVSKKKIIEAYLNVIEFGDGIFGIKKASKIYFGKHPSRLTPREGAFLAMLLPSPVRYSESWRKGEMTPYASKSVKRILKRLHDSHILSPRAYRASLAESFHWER